jgi:hypothetical protein
MSIEGPGKTALGEDLVACNTLHQFENVSKDQVLTDKLEPTSSQEIVT